jgi:uncharacterized protein YodC (DUF2158 family)
MMPDDATQTFQVGDIVRFHSGTLQHRIIGINAHGTLFCLSFEGTIPQGRTFFKSALQSSLVLVARPAETEAPHDGKQS